MDNYLFQIATSFYGQYVAVVSSNTDYLSCSVYVSFNYGKSWDITSEFPLFSAQSGNVLFLSMSSSGQYLQIPPGFTSPLITEPIDNYLTRNTTTAYR